MHVCYKRFTQLGYGNCLPKTKINWARGASKKVNLGLLFISATIEANNFEFGTQLGFGE